MVLSIIALFYFAYSQLANSPWPMFGRSTDHSARAPVNGASNNVLLWKYKTGNKILSSPVIDADGTVYVGSNDYFIYAINADGTLKWRFQTGEMVQSTPAIAEDGKVFIGSLDGYVYALESSNGHLKWRTGLNGLIYSSPAISNDGTILIGSYDKKLHALNQLDGSIKWSYAVGGDIISGNPVFSSPAIGNDGSIYFGKGDDNDGTFVGTGNIFALDKSGSLLWNNSAGYAVFASPSIAGEMLLVGDYNTETDGSTDGVLCAFDRRDGSVLWQYKTSQWIVTTPAISANGDIFFGSEDGFFYALHKNGSLKWRFNNTGFEWRSSPSVSADGLVFAGSNDGFLYAFSVADGSVKWKFKTLGAVESSPAISASGSIVVGSSDGYIYHFGLTAEYTKRILDSADITQSDAALLKLRKLCDLKTQIRSGTRVMPTHAVNDIHTACKMVNDTNSTYY